MFFMSKFFSHDFIHINELKKHNYSSQKYIVVFLEGFKKIVHQLFQKYEQTVQILFLAYKNLILHSRHLYDTSF